MKINEILSFLDTRYPLSAAADFDNSGLLIGDGERELSHAIVCLDCTAKAIRAASEANANLIITHHPVIFHPIRSLHADSIPYLLAQHGISVISMHTNLDTAEGGVNDMLCKTIGLQKVSPLDCNGFSIRIGHLCHAVSAEQFAQLLFRKLGGNVRFVDSGRPVACVGVCSGSGAEFAEPAVSAGADAFLTAEVKHHQFLEAEHRGYSLFDAGHFHTENIIIPELVRVLSENFGNRFTPYLQTAIRNL